MLSKENRLIEKKTVTFFCARFFIKEKGGKEERRKSRWITWIKSTLELINNTG